MSDNATDSAPDVPVYAGVDDVVASVGTEVGPTEWMTVEQGRVDTFADATDDHQWIHVDPARAAQGPFGATIAHGFLTLSLLPHLTAQLRRVEGATMAINYGLDRVRFPAPVLVGSRIRARMTTDAATPLPDGGVQLTATVTVEVEGGAKPACVATMLSRFAFAS